MFKGMLKTAMTMIGAAAALSAFADEKQCIITVPSGETNYISSADIDLLNSNEVTNLVKCGDGVLAVKDVLGSYNGSVTVEGGTYRMEPENRPNTACGALDGGPVIVKPGASLELKTSVQNTYMAGKTIYFGGDGFNGTGALRVSKETGADQQSATWGRNIIMTDHARVQNDMYYYASFVSGSMTLDMNGYTLTLATANTSKEFLFNGSLTFANAGNIVAAPGGVNFTVDWRQMTGSAHELEVLNGARMVFNGTSAQASWTLRLRAGGSIRATGFPSSGNAWNNNWAGPIICEDPHLNRITSSNARYNIYLDGRVSGSGFLVADPCVIHLRGGRYTSTKNTFTNGVVATGGSTVNLAYVYSMPSDYGSVVLTNATCGFTGGGDAEDARKNYLSLPNLIAYGDSVVTNGYGTWRESVTKTGTGMLAYESWIGAPLLDVQGGLFAMPATQYSGPLENVPELPQFENVRLVQGSAIDMRGHAYSLKGLSGAGSISNVTDLTVSETFTVDVARAVAGASLWVDGDVDFSGISPTILSPDGLRARSDLRFPVLTVTGSISGMSGLGRHDSTNRWMLTLSADGKTLNASYCPRGMVVSVR